VNSPVQSGACLSRRRFGLAPDVDLPAGAKREGDSVRLLFLDRTSELDNPCPLWVISGHDALKLQCPLYPRKRTRLPSIGVSALGHKRTSTHPYSTQPQYSISSIVVDSILYPMIAR
jgi:hypothetical protein